MSQADLVVVATHPRSGTHFAIDTLCLNVRGLGFDLLRGQYPSLERLLLDHDKAYTQEWEAYVHAKSVATKIIKTHLLPSEIQCLLRAGILSQHDERLLRHIMDHARFVYVYRDGRDVLVSWYHYMLEAGGGLPDDLRPRLRHTSFAEFLRMPNRYLPVVRAVEEIDANRVSYWSAHVERWLDQPRTVALAFEKLRSAPRETVLALGKELGIEDRALPTTELPPLITECGRTFPQRMLRRWKRHRARRHHRARGIDFYPPQPAYARSGRSGGWQSYFSAEDLAYFAAYGGKIMQRLGYPTVG